MIEVRFTVGPDVHPICCTAQGNKASYRFAWRVLEPGDAIEQTDAFLMRDRHCDDRRLRWRLSATICYLGDRYCRFPKVCNLPLEAWYGLEIHDNDTKCG